MVGSHAAKARRIRSHQLTAYTQNQVLPLSSRHCATNEKIGGWGMHHNPTDQTWDITHTAAAQAAGNKALGCTLATLTVATIEATPYTVSVETLTVALVLYVGSVAWAIAAETIALAQ